MDDLDSLELPPAAVRLIRKALRAARRIGERIGRDEERAKFDRVLERHLSIKGLNGTTELLKHEWREEQHKRDHGKFATKEGGKGEQGSSSPDVEVPAVRQDDGGVRDAEAHSEEVPVLRQGETGAQVLTAIPDDHLLSGLHAEVPAGLWETWAGKVKKGAQSVYERLILATPAFLKLQHVVTRLESLDDLRTLGYKPLLDGVAGHQTPDALKEGVGVPGVLGARLAAHVLAKVVAWLKAKVTVGKAAEGAEGDVDPYDLLASAVSDAIRGLADSFGLDGELPDAAGVAAALRAMESEPVAGAAAPALPVDTTVGKSVDASGHEHRGKGEGGGQFTSGGGGAEGGDKPAALLSREEKRAAATTAREHHFANSPDPDAGADALDAHHAAVRKHLEAAGASEKELSEYDRRAVKASASVRRDHEKATKLRAKAAAAEQELTEHQEKRDALEAAEPEEPEEEPEPDEPDDEESPPEPEEPEVVGYNNDSLDGPPNRADYTDDADGDEVFAYDTAAWTKYEADYVQYEKDHADWEKEAEAVDSRNADAKAAHAKEVAAVEKRNEKMLTAHEKAHDAWEKALDRHDERTGTLEERATELGEKADEAESEYAEAHSEALEHVYEHVSETEDEIHGRLDAEDEQEADLDEVDEDEEDTDDEKS